MKSIIKKFFLISIVVIVSTVAVLSFVACNKFPAAVDPIDDNYRVFYQIFVGSFSDSNGDGIGDLRGIINRFDYLNDGNINSGNSLGVQGIWLSPIFISPSYHKYDCKDYYKIEPTFGTMDDLKELIELAHSRNVKVILDLVLNHTSTTHEWFQKYINARKWDDKEDDYYYFYSDSTANTYKTYNNTGVVYECNFDSGMPELNYDSESVRQAVVDLAKFYLDMGIDGFRFDAIKYIYYNDTPRSVEFWNWYMDELRKIKPDIYTVGECWSGENEIVDYYSATNCFNFVTAQESGDIANAVRNEAINTFTKGLTTHLSSIKNKRADSMYMPFLANHDMNRAAGYLTISTGDAYMAANVYLLCSGSPTIYYGEEIGMKGTRMPSENTDANRRLAMLWGDDDSVKDPVGATYDISKQINGTVKSQLKDKNSLLNYYKKVISMRNKYPQIARGDYSALQTENSSVGGFIISYNDSTTALIHNTSHSETITISLPDGFSVLDDYIGLGSCKIKDGKLVIGPQTSAILS